MGGEEQFQKAVKSLVDSPGGILVSDIAEYLKSRIKLLSGLFIISVVAGFSLTKSVIRWLIEPERLPSDVNIIVTSPIEFILLQFQLTIIIWCLEPICYLDNYKLSFFSITSDCMSGGLKLLALLRDLSLSGARHMVQIYTSISATSIAVTSFQS